MKVRRKSNGAITLTAQSKKDSLNLLKFLTAAAGRNPDEDELVQRKEKELREQNY